MKNIDILIIGGGPTGSTLALELAVQKISSFRIIDKAPERPDKSRALAVQPRTLELLNRHGDIRNLISRGNEPVGATVAIRGQKIVDMDQTGAGVLNTAFPSTLMVSQCETEQYLDDAMARHGVSVERGVEAKSIVQDPEGVSVTLKKSDGTEERVRTKYVVGADGAHSAVRHASSLTFDGEAYPQDFILADTDVEWKADAPKNRFLLCLDDGMLTVLPLKGGKVRVVAGGMGIAKREGDPELQDFQELVDKMVPGGGGKLHDPIWLTRFHLHHRGVSNYRDGRLFVAGDAAHVHSPAGGQGMNTGIQDSINLGWKLAAVLRGERDDAFLDTYNEERRPIGQHLLNTTDARFNYIASSNWLFVRLRNAFLPWVLPWFASDPTRQENLVRAISQLDIKYRDSSIVGTAGGFEGPVRGGDRVPDAKIQGPTGEEMWFLQLLTAESHHLVLFSGVGEDASSEEDLKNAEAVFMDESPVVAKVHKIFGQESGSTQYVDTTGSLHKEFGFTAAGYVLVRPDGYVAHVGPLAALNNLFSWLR